MAVARPAIMPHVSSSGGGDDLGSEDEVKVFKDEGEEEKRSSENLTEDKSDLIDLTESEVRRNFFVNTPPTFQLPPSYSLLALHRSFACSFLFFRHVLVHIIRPSFPILLASTLVAVRTP